MMIDVTDASFETDILQRSMTTPVVVDLWAPWCGPCKTLGPIIEKVVDETNGKVVLAKINVDENPQASAAFRVQSIPAVYALANGQVVDGFVGAQPEDKIREFVNGLLTGQNEAELDALVAAGDEASLRQALAIDPAYKPAAVLLAQQLLADGRADEAATVLEAVPEDEDIAQLLEMARAGALPASERSRITDRLGVLLDQVKADDDARAEFLALLDELTIGDPGAAADWRKKLSTQLF
ncbi:MAG: thioredoxin [Actinomycetota bacterium]